MSVILIFDDAKNSALHVFQLTISYYLNSKDTCRCFLVFYFKYFDKNNVVFSQNCFTALTNIGILKTQNYWRDLVIDIFTSEQS